jgi:outer membrane lipoprotein-sorting protein
MTKLATLVATSVLLAIGLAMPRISAADEVGDILKKVDAVLTKVKDQTYQAELELLRDGKITKTLKFEVKIKGLVQKLVKFTAPGDVRDMAVLTTADGLMYVYMPSYKRVRRIAAHVRNQGFMGTDVTPEELSLASLSTGWKAKILKQDAKVWVLELRPDVGNETIYSKLVVTVNKQREGVEQIDSYDSAGKHVRSQIRTEWKDFGAVSIPAVMTYKDLRTGSQTVLRFKSCTVNQGISDSSFTTRALTRGE